MRTKILFFAVAIIIAKVIAGVEIGFLIAISMMTMGVIVPNLKLGITTVLTGLMALFFYLFSMPLPPQAFPIAYVVVIFLVLLMALATVIILAEAEKKTGTKVKFENMPTRRKALTA